MNPKVAAVLAAVLLFGPLAVGQNQPKKEPPAPAMQPAAVQPAAELANAMAQRLSNDLHVKTAVGEPMKVGSVTLIPIMSIDVSFGGGGMAAAAAPGFDGFFMSGEARPLGFVAITKKGTRFISVSKTPAK